MANRCSNIYGFWDRLEEAMTEKGMSKLKLARLIGYDRRTVYRRETTPSALAIAKICVHLNVSADWLLGLTTIKRPLNKSMEAD